MALSIKLFYITLLFVNINAMPTANPPVTPFVPDPSALEFIGWESEIIVCGVDFINMLATVCTACIDGQCAVEESNMKTQNDSLQLASQCCSDSCKLNSMKQLCGFQSFLVEHITAELAEVKFNTTKREEIITEEYDIPPVVTMNPFFF